MHILSTSTYQQHGPTTDLTHRLEKYLLQLPRLFKSYKSIARQKVTLGHRKNKASALMLRLKVTLGQPKGTLGRTR